MTTAKERVKKAEVSCMTKNNGCPEVLLLAKQIMKVIGKRSPLVVMQAVLIVIKSTELLIADIKDREKNA